MRYSKFWAVYALVLTAVFGYLLTHLDLSRGVMWLALMPLATAMCIGWMVLLLARAPIVTAPSPVPYWDWDKTPEYEQAKWDEYMAKCEAAADKGRLVTSAEAAQHLIERGHGELAYQITPAEAAAYDEFVATRKSHLDEVLAQGRGEEVMRTQEPVEWTPELNQQFNEWVDDSERRMTGEPEPDAWGKWAETNDHYDSND